MSKLRLAVLGQPRIEKDGKPVEINRRKAIALLTYLAVTGEKHTRDRLAGLFWPHEERRRARAALRRTLTALRHAVGGEWLTVDGEAVGMSLDGELWVDVRQFEDLLARYQELSSRADEESADSLAVLTEVAQLYRMDFLAQFTLDSNTDFNEWQFFQTEDLRRRFSETLSRLVAGHARRRELELAVAYARRRLSMDPLDETCHRSLMRLYAVGNRTSLALRQYKECQRRLQKELCVGPDPATTKLFEEIKARRPVDVMEPASASRASAPLPRALRPQGSHPGGTRRYVRVLVRAAIGVALVGAVAATVVLLARPGSAPVSLAVVPLEIRDAHGGGTVNLEGMTDILIAELARVPRFRVKSALAVRPYRETALPVAEIGRSLHVEWLVGGSILQTDGSIRISLSLVGVKDDTTAWAQVYTLESNEIAGTEAAVAADAARAIRRHFGLE